MNKTKVCTKCGRELPLNEFNKNKKLKDGHEGQCKKCRAESKKIHTNICCVCGKEFKARSKKIKCCSQECKHIEKGRTYSKKKSEKIFCKECGKEFNRSKSRKDRMFCSKECEITHKRKINAQNFYKRIEEERPNIEILSGEYITGNSIMIYRCKLDGYIGKNTAGRLLLNGCPVCSGYTRTHEQFMKDFYERNIHANDIEIKGKYVNDRTPIDCECKIDGYKWSPITKQLLDGQGCPKCNIKKGEKLISQYLDKNNIFHKSQYKFDNCKFYNQLPFDFYLPTLNIAIEFDGMQHYEIVEWFGGFDGFIDRKIRDTVKDIYCKENNIKLIRIPYWEMNNIEKILDKEFINYNKDLRDIV